MDDDSLRKHIQKLEDVFDEDVADMLLDLPLGAKSVSSMDLISKSFYDFDLETEEGIEKLLTLLPVLDPEIVSQIVKEVWPGYPDQNFDVKRFRLELKGYLLDHLDTMAEV